MLIFGKAYVPDSFHAKSLFNFGVLSGLWPNVVRVASRLINNRAAKYSENLDPLKRRIVRRQGKEIIKQTDRLNGEMKVKTKSYSRGKSLHEANVNTSNL